MIECNLKALFITGNQSAEAAASFLFDNPDFSGDATRPSSAEVVSEVKAEEGNSSDSSDDIDNLKMVFVVNNSLKMGIGKIAAQVQQLLKIIKKTS